MWSTWTFLSPVSLFKLLLVLDWHSFPSFKFQVLSPAPIVFSAARGPGRVTAQASLSIEIP
eukprot:54993-Hanusia_phi.AAC.1